MRRVRALGLAFLAVVLACLLPPRAWAQEDLEPPAQLESAGTFRTVINVGTLLTLPERATRVALADESLARTQLITGREILFTGLRPGRTTLFVWLVDGRRLRYLFQSEPDLDLIRIILRDLEPRIVIETTGATVILRGHADEEVARQAVLHVRELLPKIRVVDLLSREIPEISADARLEEALARVDERIRVRRIQVGPEPDPDKDTFILEGKVKNTAALVRAITVAERQLGGTEVGVVPVESSPALEVGPFAEAQPAGGLAAQIARGINLMSKSGRVLSFLEVDEIPQILVSIRVLEIDRNKARRAGFNFRITTDKLTVGSLVGPQGLSTNLPLNFVDQTIAIITAIDLLETNNFARSVAEPAVLTLSGAQATITVGGQVPIPTTAVGNVSTVSGFRFQQFGVRLSVRATLVEGDVIALELAPSISRPSAALGVGGVPGFTFQTVTTQARLHAGQSLVIAGLLTFTDSLTEQRLPLFGRIPLFRWRAKNRAETELIFIITPRFVSIDPAKPVPPIPAVDPDTIELPELEWPEERDDWSEDFEPRTFGADGVPPSLRRIPDVPVRIPGDEPGEAPDAGSAWEPLDESEIDTVPFAEEWSAPTEAEDPLEAPLPYSIVLEEADPCLNLRPEPTFWFAPIDCLPAGTRLLVLETSDDWSLVALADGREGWVASRYIAPESAIGSEPTGFGDFR